ncbi:hypothetical protein B1222_15425 [Paenibacillus larvae subsp. pulvifaciens]|nr:hypothetical protein B1222_15425 [Paenibacillus larvae subsp. pulvifaciens]
MDMAYKVRTHILHFLRTVFTNLPIFRGSINHNTKKMNKKERRDIVFWNRFILFAFTGFDYISL